MKKIKIIYWVSTGLFAVFMAFTAIPNVVSSPDAVEFFKNLQMPAYLLPFLGIAKLLGVAAIVVPGFPRLKEWAYAGLFFDLAGAMYAILAIGTPFADVAIFLLFFALEAVSYIYYHKLQAAKLKVS